MLSINGLNLQKEINNTQKEINNIEKSLLKILNKYLNQEELSLESLTFLYNLFYTKYIEFSIKHLIYSINMEKGKELLSKSPLELSVYKPKGLPLKRIQQLVQKLNEIGELSNDNQIIFWKEYCLPVLLTKDINNINDLISSVYGEGMYLIKNDIFRANSYLKSNQTEDFYKFLSKVYAY